jgi:hypothetical protein
MSDGVTDSAGEADQGPPMPADSIGRPSFTPAAPVAARAPAPAPATTAARPAASAPAATNPRTPAASTTAAASSSAASSSYSSAPASGYSSPQTYGQPSNYSRSSWPGGQDTPAAGPVGYGGAHGAGSPTGTATQAPPSESGFSSTAASAAAGIGGAAAGLAGSVSGFWQKRSERKAAKESRPRSSVRRSNKRQAMLTLSRLEPWSVMKFSFIASIVAFIILFVAVAVLYMVLSALGVFDSLQHQVSSITSSQSSAGTNISTWFSASRILGYTALLGALNIVLITALSTIGSVIYNLIAKTVGGIEVTLRETD